MHKYNVLRFQPESEKHDISGQLEVRVPLFKDWGLCKLNNGQTVSQTDGAFI